MPKEAILYVIDAHLFELTSVIIVASLILSLAAAGGFNRHRFNLITDLIHPLMMILVLTGLVQMLIDFSGSEQIGPALSVALAPTAWGLVVVAVLTPFARESNIHDSPTSFRLLGSVLLTVVLAWRFFLTSSPESFINLGAASLVISGIVMFVLIDRISGATQPANWATRLLGIGAVGFACGVIAALPYLTHPKALGPAIAVSLLSLLYSLILLCVARIWLPERVLDNSGHMPTSFTALVLPALFGVSISLALLAAALPNMH